MDDTKYTERSGIAVYDLETTGLVCGVDRIIEIGIVLYDQYMRPTKKFGRLVRPYKNSCKVPYESQRVHNITEEMLLKHGVLWTSIVDEVRGMICGDVVQVAYNKSFDDGFLKNAIPDFVECPSVDPMRVAERFSTTRSKTLTSQCALFNIDNKKAHRAVEDSEATGELLKAFCDNLFVSVDDLTRNQPLCYGKFHMEAKHFTPSMALYGGYRRYLHQGKKK